MFNFNNKKDEYLFKKEYHNKFEGLLKKHYNIEAEFSEDFSWGYTSTSTYVKDNEGNEYVARMSRNIPEKKQTIEKDLQITCDLKKLNLSVQLRDYVKNNQNKYLTFIEKETDENGNILIENKIMMVHPFIHGLCPFDMNEEILKQAILLLHEIHKIDPQRINYPLDTLATNENFFLHGDVTPSNMLVSYNKLIAIVDFELACLGPVEYDLARTAVFSWFRFDDKYPFEKLLEIISTTYPSKVKTKLIWHYAIEHSESHLNNIKKHRKIHQNKGEYKKEVRFAEKKAKQLKEIRKNLKDDLVETPNLV